MTNGIIILIYSNFDFKFINVVIYLEYVSCLYSMVYFLYLLQTTSGHSSHGQWIYHQTIHNPGGCESKELYINIYQIQTNTKLQYDFFCGKQSYEVYKKINQTRRQLNMSNHTWVAEIRQAKIYYLQWGILVSCCEKKVLPID